MTGRIVFGSKKEFLSWIKKNCTSTQYEVHITSFSEIIMKPIKSTRHLSYAYIEIYPEWDTIASAEADIMRKIPKLDIFHITKFDWDSTRDVRVRQLP